MWIFQINKSKHYCYGKTFLINFFYGNFRNSHVKNRKWTLQMINKVYFSNSNFDINNVSLFMKTSKQLSNAV